MLTEYWGLSADDPVSTVNIKTSGDLIADLIGSEPPSLVRSDLDDLSDLNLVVGRQNASKDAILALYGPTNGASLFGVPGQCLLFNSTFWLIKFIDNVVPWLPSSTILPDLLYL